MAMEKSDKGLNLFWPVYLNFAHSNVTYISHRDFPTIMKSGPGAC